MAPNLTEKARNIVAQWLLQNLISGSLRHGAQTEAAALFHVCIRTVNRIWKAVAHQQSLGIPVKVQNMKKGCPHPKKLLDEEKMKALSVRQRGSIRKVAKNLSVSVGLAHSYLTSKQLKPHTNAVKHYLTEANKLEMLKWSISMLSCISSNGKIAFQTMFNIIHIDEKWFNLSNASLRYYVVAEEKEVYRSCKSKAHIDKIMFLSVVGRPQTYMHGNVIFDGKFGIFPFIFKDPAARNSKNRCKGTIITKAIQCINRDVMRDTFLKQVIPCIMQKWPEGVSKNIIIKQDNAKPHIKDTDHESQAIAHINGFNIKLVCQPPNSPDTNVNDLGFFRSIQSLKDEKNATTVDDLIKNVTEAYADYEVYKLNNVFLTLQCCHEEIMKVKGGNNYNTPHIGKDKLRRDGKLPECIEVDEQLVKESIEYLHMQGSEVDAAYNLEHLLNGIQNVNIEEYDHLVSFLAADLQGQTYEVGFRMFGM